MTVELQILGAGSLGSLLGGLFSHSGTDVRLVGREPHVTRIRDDGLRITGEYDMTSYPEAATSPAEAEVTVVTVKSYDTQEAARSVEGLQEVVVSLQNGMGNEETLERVCSNSEVLAGTATYGARIEEPGVVRCTGRGEIEIGDPEGGESDAAKEFAGTVSDGEVEVDLRDDMPERLWSKTAVNAGINPVTAITRLTNGEAVDDPELRRTIEEAAKEVEDVASEHGVSIDSAAERAVDVARSTADNESSMLQDIKAERRTEIDSINRYVVRKADEEDVSSGLNRRLAALVRGIEKSYLTDTESEYLTGDGYGNKNENNNESEKESENQKDEVVE
ncbi:MAG: ketopantoate reductase family protein [Halobacteria archaeon]|nr:ketopantoate reductase family protein [Halobacteria archaeon]